jgi:hypothetical protein
MLDKIQNVESEVKYVHVVLGYRFWNRRTQEKKGARKCGIAPGSWGYKDWVLGSGRGRDVLDVTWWS